MFLPNNFWTSWQGFVKLGMEFYVVQLLYRMENNWDLFLKSVYDGVWIENELQICQPAEVKNHK